MRLLSLILLLSFGTVASAQTGLTSMICQAKPTKACVLEMAVEATNAAILAKPDDDNLPFARIVETASRSGSLDLAFSLIPRLDEKDSTAVAELMAAAARVGRLAETAPLLAKLGHEETTYLFMIGPVYSELGKQAELDALLEKAATKPEPEVVIAWQVEGLLRGGRRDKAVTLLVGLDDKQREMVVDITAQALAYGDDAVIAHPLAPFITGTEAYHVGLKARIAQEAGDLDLSRSLVEPLQKLPAEDLKDVLSQVAYALAASGAWKQAAELVDQLEADKRPFTLARVAELSREPQVFPLIEKAMDGLPDDYARERMARVLIRALIIVGFAPVAQGYIDSADSEYERSTRLTVAASALAQIGRGTDAVTIANSIANPHDKAWAIWEVAWKLRE